VSFVGARILPVRTAPAASSRQVRAAPRLSKCLRIDLRSRAEYLALKTAQLKRAGCRLVTISTAPAGQETPLGRLRVRALAAPKVTQRGALTDARGESLRMLEWALPADADADDARQVKRANPASWITAAMLSAQRAAIPDLAYRRFHANQITTRERALWAPGVWQAIVGEPSFDDGEAVWIGVDARRLLDRPRG
jgi:hypothetical protein